MIKKEIGVLLLFFNKTETTEIVLQRILEGKPGTLLLAQDGARIDNEFDMINVPACREKVEKLVSQIDWECSVHRNYAKANMSCDPCEYSAITWAFEIVDKLIIIEDDCLCSHSFFNFMEEMLFHYQNDERICMVSGTERFGRNPFCKESYYFTQASCGCGWGTWKRVWSDVERIARDYSYVLDDHFSENLEEYVNNTCLKVYRNYVNTSRYKREANIKAGKMLSWEFAVSTSMILESRLAINPRINLVKNIGVVPGATHSGNDIRTIPKRNRMIFELEIHELDFPLVHPEYMVRDMKYEDIFDKKFAPSRWHKFHDDLERFLLLIRYGHIKDIFMGFRRRVERIGK